VLARARQSPAEKKCARNVCSGRIAFFVVSATADQADIAFTRAERRETLREPVFL